MKIGSARFGAKDNEGVSINAAVEGTITFSHSDGSIERAHDKIENAAGIIGKLVATLHSKGLLNDDEVADFIGYPFEVKDEG